MNISQIKGSNSIKTKFKTKLSKLKAKVDTRTAFIKGCKKNKAKVAAPTLNNIFNNPIF